MAFASIPNKHKEWSHRKIIPKNPFPLGVCSLNIAMINAQRTRVYCTCSLNVHHSQLTPNSHP